MNATQQYRQCTQSNILRMLTAVLLVGLLFLSGCSGKVPGHTDLTVSIGQTVAHNDGMTTTSFAGLTSKSESLALKALDALIAPAHAAAFPAYLGKVTLQISGSGFTTASINADYNGGRFHIDAETGGLILNDSVVTLTVPDTVDLTFVITAFNAYGIQYYTGTATLTVAQLASPSVYLSVSLLVDIDPTIPQLAADCPLADSDGDGFCDVYEDVFLNDLGIPDIDNDGIVNSLDLDSDGDGTDDSLEGNTPYVDGFPLFIHINRAPTSVTLTLTTQNGETVSGTPTVVDLDVDDAHTFSIVSQPADGSASVDASGVIVSYTPNIYFSGTETFIVQAKDRAGAVVEGNVTVTVTSAIANPLLGAWGYGGLSFKPYASYLSQPDEWHSAMSKLVFSSDGTATQIGTINEFGTPTPFTSGYDYTFIQNSDGSYAVTLSQTSGDFCCEDSTTRLVLSDNGNMAIVDGTQEPFLLESRVMVKLDESKVYTNADLSGLYYGASYEYNNEGSAWGDYRAWSMIFSADGSGNSLTNAQFNGDGVIQNQTDVADSYAVSSDGQTSGPYGYLSGNGNLLAYASVSNPLDFEGGLLMKQGDQSYSTADMVGTWVLAGIGDLSGTVFWGDYGTMSCDSAGSCSVRVRSQRSDRTEEYSSFTQSLTVAADGSFGTSLSPDAPSYAGAIGNNGNTLLFNVSFDLADPAHRDVMYAVKCSSCTQMALQNAPVAGDDGVTTLQNTSVLIDVLANDSDADSDPLTISISNAKAPQNGTVAIETGGIRYTPNTDYTGGDEFLYIVSDGNGGAAGALVTVTVQSPNTPPVANAQAVTTDEDTAFAITLTGSDVDVGTILTYAVATDPANGVLSGTAPNLTYTPNANYNGADSFTFTVNDGTVDSTAATIDITVTALNDVPVANGQAVSTDVDTSVAITLTGSDVDVGTTLTYAVVSDPTYGVLAGTAPNLTYTPNGGYNGTDSFTFTVNDGVVDSTLGIVDVVVYPDTDGDGINDSDETTVYLTDPNLPDSDFDGFYDGHEIAAGTNPNLDTDYPSGTIVNSTNGNNNITVDTTWTLANSPYLVENSVLVQSGATLTIQSGVVVKFNAASLNITVYSGGALLIQGGVSTPQHVVVTSMKDDSINGDSDGVVATPAAGDWQSIVFNEGSSGTVSYLESRYAYYGVNITGASPSFSNVTVDMARFGIYLAGGTSATSPVFTNTTLTNLSDNGIYIAGNSNMLPSFTTGTISGLPANNASMILVRNGANPTISGYTVSGGNYGLELSLAATGSYSNIIFDGAATAAVSFADTSAPNTFDNITLSNTLRPYYMIGRDLPTLGSVTIAPSVTHRNVVGISGSLAVDATLGPDPIGDPIGDGSGSVWELVSQLTVPLGDTLDISAGTVLKASSGDVYVQGIMNINGTVTNPVIMTSIKDDSVKGDSDGVVDTPWVGDWFGIGFDEGSIGTVNYLESYYANTGVYIVGASPTFNNLTVDNANIGIDLKGAAMTTDPVFTNTTLTNIYYYGIYMDGLDYLDPYYNYSMVPTFNGGTSSGPIYVQGYSNPTIDGFTVTGFHYGLELVGAATGSYTNCTFDGASEAAVSFADTSAPITFNNITLSNATRPILLVGRDMPALGSVTVDPSVLYQNVVQIEGPLINDSTLLPDPIGDPFGDGSGSVWELVNALDVPPGITLNIAADTVIKVDSGPIAVDVWGTLNVNGTDTNPVIITSIKDDTVKGDSDRGPDTPIAWEWDGNNFIEGSGGTVNYLDIRYAARAINITGASPIFSNLTVDTAGYGIYLNGVAAAETSPTFSSTTVTNTTREGIYIDAVTYPNIVEPSFDTGTISEIAPGYSAIYVTNTASTTVTNFDVSGGSYGLLLDGALNSSFTHSTFRDAEISGIYIGGGNIDISNNTILANGFTSPDSGGGINVVNTDTVTIDHNLIRSNLAASSGGGINIGGSTTGAVIRNNLILDNSASQGGGVVIGPGLDATLLHNTISGNIATDSIQPGGGGMYVASGATATFTDNILWGNVDAYDVANDVLNEGSMTESYNLTGDGSLSGTGDITGDPVFVQNWYLGRDAIDGSGDSPAVDADPAATLPSYLPSSATTCTTGTPDLAGSDNCYISADSMDLGYHHTAAASAVVDADTSTYDLTPWNITSGVGGSGDIVILPKDSSSQLLGLGLRVELSTPLYGTLGQIVDRGDGTYTVTYTTGSSSGSETITITVNGTEFTWPVIFSW